MLSLAVSEMRNIKEANGIEWSEQKTPVACQLPSGTQRAKLYQFGRIPTGELALQLLSENKNDLKSLEDETLKNWNDNLLKPLCGIDLKNFDEGNSRGSTVRPSHASSVSLNPSPEFGEFLGAQPEKKGLEAQEGLSEKTTEAAQKRKEDSRQEESYQKVRRFNHHDKNLDH